MDLSLKEKLLIVLLDPEKGRFIMEQTRMTNAISACIIFEMKEQGIIDFNQNRISVRSFKFPKDTIHQEILKKLKAGNKERKLSFWLMKLSWRGGHYRKSIISNLQSKQVIGKERKYFINIIPYTRYFFININLRRKNIEHLRAVVFNLATPVQEDFLLLGLISVANANRVIYRSREEKKLMKERIKELLSDAMVDKDVLLILKRVKEAIQASSAIISGI
ncbi:MAG: GPP34 family phosphoprotein [Bacteroidales bacterium]|nr:GPP34 family phosphoprotein [Bacteroidales bacterium]